MKKISWLLAAMCLLSISCQRQQGRAVGNMDFVIGNGTEIQSIDPSRITGVPEHRVNLALFEGLVRYDPRTAMPIPAVADSWSISDDGTVITFNIRRNVTWSDGVPITAHTIVESWLYHLSPTTASEYAYMPGMLIKGANEFTAGTGRAEDVAIRALDDHTFEVTLLGPAAFAVNMMAHYAFQPLPMHVIKEYGANWTRVENFVGNGPFVLQEWIPNDRLTVVPNNRYWDRENVHLTKITFLPIEDTNTAYQSFRNGEIDWSTNPPVTIIDELQLRRDFHVSTLLGTYYILVNNMHPILYDPRIRMALSMSFNRNELISRVIRGGQQAAYGIVPPMEGYNVIRGDNHFNVARARQLLAEAGFPDGYGLPTFSFMYNTLDLHRIVAEYLQQVWRENLGINIALQNFEWATFLAERKTSRMHLARSGWIADYADPQNFLELLITDGGNNDGNFRNSEFDALLRQAASMTGGSERLALMRQAEDIAIVQNQAVIPVFYYVSENLIDLDVWAGWYTNNKDIHPWVGIRRR